MTGLQST